jgi:dihydrofolate reductase
MARIIISENVSLDGINQDEGFRHSGWLQQHMGPAGEEWSRMLLEEAHQAKALLLGRRTDEYFAARWPSRSGEYADALNGLRTYVVSATSAVAAWAGSTVLQGDAVEQVSRLRRELDGDIFVYGSARLARTIIDNDLADELRLVVFPVVLGVGERLFGTTGDSKALRLVEARPVADTLSRLRYEVLH